MRRTLTAVTLLVLFACPALAQDPDALWAEFMKYAKRDEYARAVEVGERLLPIALQRCGPNHAFTAKVQNGLAWAYLRCGQPSKAEPLAQGAVRIAEATCGPRDFATGETVDTLAEVKSALGEYSEALKLYLRALDIFVATRGPDDERVLRCRSDLAAVYSQMGDYSRAEATYRDLLARFEKSYGPDSLAVVAALDGMGGLYEEMGDLGRADATVSREIGILEKKGDERTLAIALDNLGNIRSKEGQLASAVALHERALRIWEKGGDSFDTATCLNNLASAHVQLRAYAKAVPLFERSLAIQKKVLGPSHPLVAGTISNLAVTDLALKRDDVAETRIRAALAIREKTLGPLHVQTAYSLGQLAAFEFDHGRRAEALALGKRVLAIEEAVMANLLSFTTEQQRLAFLTRYNPYPFIGTLGDASAMAQAVLRHKGVVLDSLIEDRRVARLSNDPAVGELLASKKHLLQIEMSGTGGERVDALRAKVEALETRVARAAGLGKTRLSLTVTTPAVQAALPRDAVLVEYVRYLHRLPDRTVEPHYGVVVVPAAGSPTWISLGDAKSIDETILAYRAMARGEMPQRAMVVGRTSAPVRSDAFASGLKTLTARVWDPVQKSLPSGAKTVIISPDGDLNFVSFATLLLGDDQFLAERLAVRYVASGRDLLRELAAPSTQPVNIVCNPDFGAGAGGPSSGSAVTGGVDKLHFQPLPGTAAEGQALTALCGKVGWPVRTLAGTAASETGLFSLRSPRILHMATHGYFLADVGFGEKGVRLHSPMLRSGLALSGANGTLAQWMRGQAPPIGSDGMVAAAEVGSLPLDGTWLVTLSACDSGTGEVRAGEGVLGLRRAFIAAGARHLVMTLWPVSDADTAEFMVEFYNALAAGASPEEALPDVQRRWLARLRAQRGVQAAVQVAGPFIVSSQGRR